LVVDFDLAILPMEYILASLPGNVHVVCVPQSAKFVAGLELMDQTTNSLVVWIAGEGAPQVRHSLASELLGFLWRQMGGVIGEEPAHRVALGLREGGEVGDGRDRK